MLSGGLNGGEGIQGLTFCLNLVFNLMPWKLIRRRVFQAAGNLSRREETSGASLEIEGMEKSADKHKGGERGFKD